MARCYYLDYKSTHLISSRDDYYYCTLCPNKCMPINDPQVKYVCNAEYGEKYRDCPIYKNYR